MIAFAFSWNSASKLCQRWGLLQSPPSSKPIDALEKVNLCEFLNIKIILTFNIS